MCDKAVDDSLAALKLIPDQFVTSKMIKKLCTASQADDGLHFFDENSGDVTIRCNEMGILSENHKNVKLNNNFDEDDPDTITLIRLLARHSKFKKRKVLKKKISEELMPIAWHTKDGGSFACQDMRKKKQNQFLLSNAFNASVVYNIEVLEHFDTKT